MLLGLSDSDDEGGYGLPIPQAQARNPPLPENKEPEVSPREPSPPPAAAPEPPQNQFAMQVSQVQNSSLVQGLQQGQLTQDDAQKCRDIIGYCPDDLLDKQIQKTLIQNGHPALQAAFKNRMLRAFVMGINSAQFTLSCGLISLEISRFLLTECVKKLGLNSVCRERLLPISKQINQQVDALNQKRVAFVLQMAEIAKNMGTVSNLLRFNASADAIVKRLETCNLDLEGQMAEVDEAANLSLAVIGEGADFILSVLREDDGYQKQEKKVRELDIEHRKALAEYQEASERRKEAEYHKMGVLKQLQVNKATLETQRSYRARDLPEIQNRAASHAQTITNYHETIRRVNEGAEMDEKEAKKIADDTRNAALKEIEDQRSGIDAQIKLIDDEIRKKGHQVEDFRNRSQTASDGRERKTTYSRSGYWWRWWGSYSYKSEYVQARPNEKQRLEAMASTVEREKNDLLSKREALVAKKKDIKRTLMRQMQDESLRIQDDASQRSANLRDRRVKQIEQQIIYMERLAQVSQQERQSIEAELLGYDRKIGELEKELSRAEDDLKSFQAEDSAGAIEFAGRKQAEQDAREQLRKAKKELQKYTEVFGTNTGEDFTSFMRIFTMLNSSVAKLPQTLQNMQAAFGVATKTFNSEVFQSDLALLSQSGGDVTAYLQQTTDEMHAVCELAFQVVDRPGRALMGVDHTSAVAAIQASSGAEVPAIEGSGPQIEEVE